MNASLSYREFSARCRAAKASGGLGFSEAVDLVARSPHIAELSEHSPNPDARVLRLKQIFLPVELDHFRKCKTCVSARALIRRAEHSADHYDALLEGVRRLDGEGVSLCRELQLWRTRNRGRRTRRPAGTKGRRAGAYLARDTAIVMLLYQLNQAGLNVSRNSEPGGRRHAPKRESAADIVARALFACGLGMTYEAVIRVWYRHHLAREVVNS